MGLKTKRIGIVSGLLVLMFILGASARVSASDTTPPQLSIYIHSGNIGNSRALIHGISYDENGMQKVTVNGEEAKGYWTSVHFFWLKEVDLAEGENIITVISYDNSTNHNSYSENITLNYKPDLYQGPTVRIIPVETMPSNNATLRCVVNPNGYPTSVRLWYGEKEYSFSPFNHGSDDLGPSLTGMDEISLNYTLEREEEPNVGDQFLYVFIVRNRQGFAYSEIGNVHITEPIELPQESDNTPPVLEISSFLGRSEINVPNSSIIIHGIAYDENGILKVEINGEEVNGHINENSIDWQMNLNLAEGTNHIVVKAYDNSENRNWIENSVNITYQKENYLGPIISLIPIEYISIKEPTIKCIINPNGIDNTYTKLWYSEPYENAPFSRGMALGFKYNGTENILINYHLGVGYSLQVGDLITYMFRVSNQEGLAQTKVATVSVIDPDIPPPPLPPILSNLIITPLEIDLGDNVTISLDIENYCSQSQTYGVDIHIENVNDPPPTWPPMDVYLRIWVDLEAYESKTVSHTIIMDTVGNFNVTVNDMTGSFTVVTRTRELVLEWSRTFGGPYLDQFSSVQQTTDGGYIMTGGSNHYDSWHDVYLVKTDSNGKELWNRTFGWPQSSEYGRSVRQTSDGGYIIVGSIDSYGVYRRDVYLVKTDADGILVWNKTFGGFGDDEGNYVQQTADKGYIIAGRTTSFDVDSMDVYLIKTDSDGNMIFNTTFGGSNCDYSCSVQQTNDGGYILAGTTCSFGSEEQDFYLIKTSADGILLWNKTFGDVGYNQTYRVWPADYGVFAQQTSDGGYIIAGSTRSFGAEDYDACLVKTDSDGNELWHKLFGSSHSDHCQFAQETSDGGFILVGSTNSFGAGINDDVYLVKTDSDGNEEWYKTFGGSKYDGGWSVQQTSDGGYIIAGGTESFGKGEQDGYLIKLIFLEPADFVVSNLSITREKFYSFMGDINLWNFKISVDITNVGEQEGSHTVLLRVDDSINEWIASETVTLRGGETTSITFDVRRGVGSYTAEVDGLTGSFEVKPFPAEFVISELEVSPTDVEVGDLVTFTVLVENIGETEGTYTVEFKLLKAMSLPSQPPSGDGETIRTQNVTLAAGSGRYARIYFVPHAGTYQVSVENLTEIFDVRAPLEPAELVFSNLQITTRVKEGQSVNISVDVTNVGEEIGGCTVELKVNGHVVESVEIPPFGGIYPDYDKVTATQFFELTRSAGTYEVEVEGLTGSFTVARAEPSFWDKIPGFPYESIILGLVAVIVIIWRSHKS